MISRNPEFAPELAASPASSRGVHNFSRTGQPVTLFAVPKPFSGYGARTSVDIIQRNAIRSWAQLRPKIDVLLIGDEAGIRETAEELGVRHVGGLERSSLGTPLLSSAFELAHRNSTSPLLAYCNSDVIFTNDFVQSIGRVANSGLKDFIAFGRRIDLDVDREIDFADLGQLAALKTQCQRHGKLGPVVCKEYFVFRRGSYENIPNFSVGRGNWDNWMVHWAKLNRHPVVDMSKVITAIHQKHRYGHVKQGRWGCYVSGEEARENQLLAGGRNIISGSTGTWRLDDQGLRKIKYDGLNISFWADLPRFLRLILDLMAGV